ncbi:MAG TPA: septum formation initiator family protein [Gemmatimonadales bacterium]
MTRVVAAAVALALISIGIWGGEYSTPNWLTLRRQVRAEHAAVDSLRGTLDSLRREAAAIEKDPATQERVAREQFGMIRPGEILYRIEGGAVDSTGR